MKKQSITKINFILSLIALLIFPLNVLAWVDKGDRSMEASNITNESQTFIEDTDTTSNADDNVVVLGTDDSLEEAIDKLRKKNIKVKVISDDSNK